jgi:hypothetical protein
VLSFVFDRLYVLRNQLVHGGSTWNSGINRTQVRDGTAILGFLMPVFADLMDGQSPPGLGQALLSSCALKPGSIRPAESGASGKGIQISDTAPGDPQN